MEAISIDCAVMEKASNITMCPMDVTWSDIGSRDAISELLVQQKVVNTNPYLINDDKNNLVFSKRKLIIDAITDSFIILSEA